MFLSSIKVILFIAVLCMVYQPQDVSALTNSGPITATSGQVITGLKISSTSGPCIRVPGNVSNVTIRDSDIGPCGEQGIIVQNGASNVKIWDNYIHNESHCGILPYPDGGGAPDWCGDKHDGVFAYSASDIHIEGNYIYKAESNIELHGVTDVVVRGNVLLQPQGPFPRGQNIQVWSLGNKGSSNILVENNIGIASRHDLGGVTYPEDIFNFGGNVRDLIVRNNYIEGGYSGSGCGLITDGTVVNAQLVDNILVRTGQCGIGIAGGTNVVVRGNKIANTYLPGEFGNTALYIWDIYEIGCSGIVLENNIAVGKKPNGSYSSLWNAGNCGSVQMSGNTFNAQAEALLEPYQEKLPRPPLVPQPYENLAPFPNASSFPNPTTSPQPTTTPDGTSVVLNLRLTGVGSNTSLGLNNNPVRNSLPVEVALFDGQGNKSNEGNGTLNYTNGAYQGTAIFAGGVSSGTYSLKARFDNTLWKTVSTILNITSGQNNNTPQANLTTGDIDSNNELNLLDYNAVISCYGSGPCSNEQKTDLNLDGLVDELDLNILYSGFSTRQGD